MNRDHLTLAVGRELSGESCGDESGASADADDAMLMFRMELEIRFRRIEKQLKQLHKCPEISAMLARMANRESYG